MIHSVAPGPNASRSANSITAAPCACPSRTGTGLPFMVATAAMNGSRQLAPAWGPVLWHAGGGPGAPTSYLQLLPQQGLGLFLAFNSDAARFLDQVLGAFYDHYDPLHPATLLPAPTAADATSPGQDLDRFAGVDRPTGYAHRTVAKLLLLQRDDVPRVIASGGTLAIRWLPGDAAPPQPLV